MAGVEILSIPLAPLSLLIHEGIAGVSGALIGVFMVILGITLWLAPAYRVFAGIATLIFAVASLVLSNLGGFLIGFLLGVVGGCLAVSWVPGPGTLRQAKPGTPLDSDGPDGGPSGGGGPNDHGSDNGGPDEGGSDEGPGGWSDVPDETDRPAPRPSTGPEGDAAPTADGRNKVQRSGRLGTLGMLPVGALLATVLPPHSPSAHSPAAVGALPGPVYLSTSSGQDPRTPQDPRTRQGLSVCSLLNGLLTAVGPTMNGVGSGLTIGTPAPGGSRGGQPPRNDRGSGTGVGAAIPAQRTDGPDAGRPSPPGPGDGPQGTAEHPTLGGLLSGVTGLLGLNRPPAAAPDPAQRPGPTPDAPNSPAPAASEPGAPANGPGDALQPAGAAPAGGAGSTSALVDVSLPALPDDGGMNGLASLFPLHLRVQTGEQTSPGCTTDLSLGVSAEAQRIAARAAAQPARVRTPLLVLTGLTYHGIGEAPTELGPQRVLVFTAFRVDIAGLRQTAPLLPPSCGLPKGSSSSDLLPPFARFTGIPGLGLPLLGIGLPGIGLVDPNAPGPWFPCQGTMETDGGPGRTATAIGGPVVLLTRVLSGSLLGLLPVTFTPDMPPPLPPGLTLPIPIFFTGVTAFNQSLQAQELDVPDLHQTASG